MIDQVERNALQRWFQESVIIKLGLIGILTLLLLIPSSMIQDLIWERQDRQREVIKEITDKWSGSQLVEGPVMVLPYKTIATQVDAAGKTSYREILTNIYLLPEALNIVSKADPTVLHRGIFDAVVYSTKVRVNGSFGKLELKKAGINPDNILWDKVKLAIGLSDLKGLKSNPVMKLSSTSYQVEPDFSGLKLFPNNLIIQPDLSAEKNTALPFSFELDMRGSSELNFLHLGKSTNVTVEGDWNNPSFSGNYLPEEREVTASGFSATWKMPYFNRPFPQQWIEANTSLHPKATDASFGVKFILPVDQYQKTMRSAKYAILIILLTFISLFFTELVTRKKVHLLQYVLIGAAMTIYYTLLLSFSEQVGFNVAYLIASVATVALIGCFIAAILNNKKPALLFAAILTLFYSFIYVIIQLQDMALLFGSIGLFVVVAVMMYLSAKIDWNRKTTAELA
ncbi:cell envelope integrity protein CreD [Pedobacter sp. SYSU D00535]|uniref:cell envelope integrity protein CreD n=1 Tax=Pedobacter sp. SYSU D00535 TaxID=2810308 RepID=UPI001A97B6A9|nr:cell envelope integrity protein CreD [Pedobacter sp. SYSU D00535]